MTINVGKVFSFLSTLQIIDLHCCHLWRKHWCLNSNTDIAIIVHATKAVFDSGYRLTNERVHREDVLVDELDWTRAVGDLIIEIISQTGSLQLQLLGLQ